MRVRSRHSSKQQRTVRVALVSVAIVAVGMAAPKIFSAVSAAVLTPVHSVHVWLEESSSIFPSFFRDRRALAEEVKELEQALAVAKRDSLTQQRLWEENNRLRNLLGADDEVRIAAGVIARPNELPHDMLQIDRGSTHGVTVGAPVFVGRDVVIGLVSHVAPQYAFVTLVTDPGFSSTAFISGPNIVVSMEGIGGGMARVHVPQGIPLRKGNLVYLPSIEPGTYGRITYVENEPTQPEQYGYISPDIAISGLFQVAVGAQSQVTQSPEVVDEQILELMRKSLVVPGVTRGVIATTSATGTPATTTIETDI